MLSRVSSVATDFTADVKSTSGGMTAHIFTNVKRGRVIASRGDVARQMTGLTPQNPLWSPIAIDLKDPRRLFLGNTNGDKEKTKQNINLHTDNKHWISKEHKFMLNLVPSTKQETVTQGTLWPL